MSEREEFEDKDFNASDSRRSFLKKLGILGVGLVGTGLAGKEYGEHLNSERESILNEMMASTTEVIVEPGDNLWNFYETSGWKEVDFENFHEAVKRLNPNENIDNLKPTMGIVIPKRAEEKE